MKQREQRSECTAGRISTGAAKEEEKMTTKRQQFNKRGQSGAHVMVYA